jgi:hypothetical protein
VISRVVASYQRNFLPGTDQNGEQIDASGVIEHGCDSISCDNLQRLRIWHACREPCPRHLVVHENFRPTWQAFGLQERECQGCQHWIGYSLDPPHSISGREAVLAIPISSFKMPSNVIRKLARRLQTVMPLPET